MFLASHGRLTPPSLLSLSLLLLWLLSFLPLSFALFFDVAGSLLSICQFPFLLHSILTMTTTSATARASVAATAPIAAALLPLLLLRLKLQVRVKNTRLLQKSS